MRVNLTPPSFPYGLIVGLFSKSIAFIISPQQIYLRNWD